MKRSKFAMIAVVGLSIATAACTPPPPQNVAIPPATRAAMADAPLARVVEPTPKMKRQSARGQVASGGGLVSLLIATTYSAIQAAATGLEDLPEVTTDLTSALEEKMMAGIAGSTNAALAKAPALTDEANVYENRETRGPAMAAAARAADVEGYLINARIKDHGLVSEGAIGEESFRYAVVADVSVVDVAAGIEVGRSVCTSNQRIGTFRDITFGAAEMAGRDVSELRAQDNEYVKARKVAAAHNSINGPAPAVPGSIDLAAVSTEAEQREWVTMKAVNAAEKCAGPMLVKLLN